MVDQEGGHFQRGWDVKHRISLSQHVHVRELQLPPVGVLVYEISLCVGSAIRACFLDMPRAEVSVDEYHARQSHQTSVAHRVQHWCSPFPPLVGTILPLASESHRGQVRKICLLFTLWVQRADRPTSGTDGTR